MTEKERDEGWASAKRLRDLYDVSKDEETQLRTRLAEVERERDALAQDARACAHSLISRWISEKRRDVSTEHPDVWNAVCRVLTMPLTHGTPDVREDVSASADLLRTSARSPEPCNESSDKGLIADSILDDAATIADLRRQVEERDATIGKLRAALDRINEIRNDIVGRQSLNWSLHIYPLVAALNDAGYVSADYKLARESIVSANATIARLRAVAEMGQLILLSYNCLGGQCIGHGCAVCMMRDALSTLAPGDLGKDGT